MDLAAILNPSEPLSAADASRLRQGLRTWVLAGGLLSLQRCLGLPSTPGQLRRGLRDAYLAQAADLLGASEWERAARLHEAVQRFDGHQWPCWLELYEAPAHATDLERLLFLAFKANPGRMPQSAQGMAALLAKKSAPKS